ncbi:MAG: ATP-binding cassette domain-containing protein [Syntrophaceticus schinkii]|jgi:ABC-2 type transport system ATP-binding protein|uniref:Daunorubicin resistance ABC transporter ATPase subunit n=2 Tax=Syntrophaceticus schinkii TaxID=499207 RepID=A0A0B7MD73_9FIRM|nr:ATP-binding cassette domain-containing protein [Syntrophaceticus schinkii]MDD4261862.1 ATP-binding cassette domain-containing protein [Syntrophaceticus schinkii]MDD4674247.1 ATP-binding cassette domain-containing protein [Syntrophaceticus schinkii]CEO88514.1 Daunorubicin resistance ABC transporter ATPase subunit [Syntrophaceticus schinkii]
MNNPPDKMLEVHNVVKRYGSVTAVDGVSFSVNGGEIFGLLGPNGAGKSTTIRMLTTLTKPTAGELFVDGYSVVNDQVEVKRRIGVVPQQNNFEQELTGRENLLLHALLHKMPKKIRDARIAELLAYVGLEDRADERVRNYSGGMARRLIIARALLHGPSILFLDEPTVGLDPQTRRKIWDLILLMNRSGVTVLLTTHYIEEAESLCHRVGIVDYGKLIALDSPKKLSQNIGEFCVEFLKDFGVERHFFATRQEARNFVSGQDFDTVVRRTNLEDVFVELTGRVSKELAYA